MGIVLLSDLYHIITARSPCMLWGSSLCLGRGLWLSDCPEIRDEKQILRNDHDIHEKSYFCFLMKTRSIVVRIGQFACWFIQVIRVSYNHNFEVWCFKFLVKKAQHFAPWYRRNVELNCHFVHYNISIFQK